MTRRWAIFLVLLLFAAPIVEAAMPVLLLDSLRGLSFFPAFMIILFLYAGQPWVMIVVAIGAMWRDVILLTPYAPTLLGAVLAMTTIIFLRRFLTNRSLLTDGLMVLAAYGSYIAGTALAFWLAKLLGLSGESTRLFLPAPLIANFVFTVIFILIWRSYHPEAVSHNFYP